MPALSRLLIVGLLGLLGASVDAVGSGGALAQLQLGPPVQTQPPPAGTPRPPTTTAPRPPREARPAQPSDVPATPQPPRERRQALPGDAVAPAPDETVIAPPRQRIVNPTAVFSGLDKITGRIIAFDVAINETVQFGALQVTPRVCYTRPPTETPQTTSFTEVAEVTLQGQLRPIFAGWMFSASPGLSGVEHPVYDVWLTDCKQSAPFIPGQAQQPQAVQPASPPPRR